jgi:hypothetical protein
LIREAFYRTQSAQVTVSPEFTYCNDCSRMMRGLADACDECGSANVEQEDARRRLLQQGSQLEQIETARRAAGAAPRGLRGRACGRPGRYRPVVPGAAGGDATESQAATPGGN